MTSGRFRKPARIDGYYAEPVDRQLRVDYITRPAHRFDSVSVEETNEAVAIAIVVTAPLGPTRAAGHMHSLTVQLGAPLGDRRVVDACTGCDGATTASTDGSTAAAGRAGHVTAAA